MKHLQKNVLFSGIGYVLPLLAALGTIPVMVKYLGADLYGLYSICISLVGFMTLVDLGVGQTVIKYVAEYEATNQQHKVKPILDIAFLIYLVIGLVSAGSLFLFSGKIAHALYDNDINRQALAVEVLELTAIALFFSYTNQFFLNVSKAYHRFDAPAMIQGVSNLGGIVLATVLLLAGYSIEAIMFGYIAIYFTAFCSGFLACRRVLPPGIRIGIAFDKEVFQKIVSFSFYTFISNLLASLTSRVDKLLIGSIVNTQAVTYYQIPYTIAQMANGIIHTLVQIMFPRFSELVGLKNDVGLLELYKKVTKTMMLISMAIAVLLISAGGEFLSIWISPEFAEKTNFALMVMASQFFLNSNIVTAFWVIQSKGNAKLTALVSVIGAASYFAAVYYLGSKYSYNGAAFALFALLLPIPLMFFWIEKQIGHKYSEYLLWLLVTSMSGALISFALLKLNAYINNSLLAILVDGTLVAGIPLLVAWFYFRRKNALSSVSAYS